MTEEHGDLAALFERWAEGVRYQHEHYWADPSTFVGHVPAPEHRAAEQAVLAALPGLIQVQAAIPVAMEHLSQHWCTVCSYGDLCSTARAAAVLRDAMESSSDDDR